ncbi:hypothetical protein HK098_000440 [Nowakowskiella sp. JEL0407]|nr:hypothetical protein HK098_000440 [Nowakowskiella sp. JEL0407]
MYMDGYVNQTNIDYSSTVIETMSRIHSDTHIKYLTADIFKLSETPSLQQHTFDIIIDKGTIDSFLTKSKEKDDQWNPTEITLGDSRKYLDQVISKLDIDGCFLQITWDPPHFRRKILECCDTVRDGKVLRVVEIKKVTGGGVLEYFIYVCKFINP